MARTLIFLLLCGLHIALGVMAYYGVEGAQTIFAATSYVPLLLFGKLGVPVFAGAESGGWGTPSYMGWGIVGMSWLPIWLLVAHFLGKAAEPRKYQGF